MESIGVYVPVSELFGIRPGSGIVGTLQLDGRLLVDYEGNVYGAQNIVTYADRVMQAWGRHSVRYPTVARLALPAETMDMVGEFLPDSRTVVIGPGKLQALMVEEWLRMHPVPPEELQVTRP